MEGENSKSLPDEGALANEPSTLEQSLTYSTRRTEAGPSSRPVLHQVGEYSTILTDVYKEEFDEELSENFRLSEEIDPDHEQTMNRTPDDTRNDEVRCFSPSLVHPHIARIVSEDRLKSRMEAAIQNLLSVLPDVSHVEAASLLHASQWNIETAVMVHFGEKPRSRSNYGIWRRLSGKVTCIACLENKNADKVLMHATDCGVAVCAACWKYYFHIELIKNTRNTLRCPLANCFTIVPDWLIEACCNAEPSEFTSTEDDEIMKAHIIAYRAELMSDFVASAEDLFYCPHQTCDSVLSLNEAPQGLNQTVSTECGHRFCYGCMFESHFPANCTTARLVQNISSRDEVDQIARNFKDVHRCGNQACGALLSNDGGCNEFKCDMCNETQKWNELDNIMESIKKSGTIIFTPEQVNTVRKELALARDWTTLMNLTQQYHVAELNFLYSVELVTWAKLKAIIEGPKNWNEELIESVSNCISSFGTEKPEDLNSRLEILIAAMENSFHCYESSCRALEL